MFEMIFHHWSKQNRRRRKSVCVCVCMDVCGEGGALNINPSIRWKQTWRQ